MPTIKRSASDTSLSNQSSTSQTRQKTGDSPVRPQPTTLPTTSVKRQKVRREIEKLENKLQGLDSEEDALSKWSPTAKSRPLSGHPKITIEDALKFEIETARNKAIDKKNELEVEDVILSTKEENLQRLLEVPIEKATDDANKKHQLLKAKIDKAILIAERNPERSHPILEAARKKNQQYQNDIQKIIQQENIQRLNLTTPEQIIEYAQQHISKNTNDLNKINNNIEHLEARKEERRILMNNPADAPHIIQEASYIDKEIKELKERANSIKNRNNLNQRQLLNLEMLQKNSQIYSNAIAILENIIPPQDVAPSERDASLERTNNESDSSPSPVSNSEDKQEASKSAAQMDKNLPPRNDG